MTEGVIGLGTLLKIGDGATPEVFAAIAEVKDITGPGLSREFAEFTRQQSSGGYREYKVLEKALQAAEDAAAQVVRQAVESAAPRKSGQLAGSITVFEGIDRKALSGSPRRRLLVGPAKKKGFYVTVIKCRSCGCRACASP